MATAALGPHRRAVDPSRHHHRNRPLTVAAIDRRLRAVDRAIDALSDDNFDAGQVPFLAERARLLALLVGTPARNLDGIAVKLRVALEVLESADPMEGGDMVASAARDVNTLRGVFGTPAND